jgi:hypothetical protein
MGTREQQLLPDEKSSQYSFPASVAAGTSFDTTAQRAHVVASRLRMCGAFEDNKPGRFMLYARVQNADHRVYVVVSWEEQ